MTYDEMMKERQRLAQAKTAATPGLLAMLAGDQQHRETDRCRVEKIHEHQVRLSRRVIAVDAGRNRICHESYR